MSSFLGDTNYSPSWPGMQAPRYLQPGDREASPGQQPQESGHQMQEKAPSGDTSAMEHGKG